MKLALLLVVGLALAGTALVAAPVASACPDPDNPCTPQPLDPLDCPWGTPTPTGNPVKWAICMLG